MSGSKQAHLGANAMELIPRGVSALPINANPRDDLAEAALVFRGFALTPSNVRGRVRFIAW